MLIANPRSEESESSSELKNVSGVSAPDPHGPLVNGAEAIKGSIVGFTDARKSDIDNEHLPPDLFDLDEVASTGNDSFDAHSGSAPDGSTAPSSPTTPASPGRSRSPSESSGDPKETTASGRFKKGHGRQSSLGTTMTSPSTRRRSLENTISMIREAMTKDDSRMGTSSASKRHADASMQRSSQRRLPATSRPARPRRRATRSQAPTPRPRARRPCAEPTCPLAVRCMRSSRYVQFCPSPVRVLAAVHCCLLCTISVRVVAPI